MSEKTNSGNSPAQNPAKGVNTPSMPTKTTRNDVKKPNTSRGNRR